MVGIGVTPAVPPTPQAGPSDRRMCSSWSSPNITTTARPSTTTAALSHVLPSARRALPRAAVEGCGCRTRAQAGLAQAGSKLAGLAGSPFGAVREAERRGGQPVDNASPAGASIVRCPVRRGAHGLWRLWHAGFIPRPVSGSGLWVRVLWSAYPCRVGGWQSATRSGLWVRVFVGGWPPVTGSGLRVRDL